MKIYSKALLILLIICSSNSICLCTKIKSSSKLTKFKSKTKGFVLNVGKFFQGLGKVILNDTILDCIKGYFDKLEEVRIHEEIKELRFVDDKTFRLSIKGIAKNLKQLKYILDDELLLINQEGYKIMEMIKTFMQSYTKTNLENLYEMIHKILEKIHMVQNNKAEIEAKIFYEIESEYSTFLNKFLIIMDGELSSKQRRDLVRLQRNIEDNIIQVKSFNLSQQKQTVVEYIRNSISLFISLFAPIWEALQCIRPQLVTAEDLLKYLKYFSIIPFFKIASQAYEIISNFLEINKNLKKSLRETCLERKAYYLGKAFGKITQVLLYLMVGKEIGFFGSLENSEVTLMNLK